VTRRLPFVADVYYGWVVVAACFTAAFVVFGIAYSFGVFFTEMLAAFGRSRGATSFVFSVHTLVMYTGAALVGSLVVSVGVRRSMAVGTVLYAAGLLATTRAGSVPALYVTYGVVTALGMGTLFVVAYGTVPRWFDRRRGLAMGITTVGIGAGMVVVPAVSQRLITLVGWRTAFLALVGPFTLFLLGATYVIRDHPDDVGADVTREFTDGQPAPPAESQRDAVRAFLGQPAFALLFVGWVLVFATLYVLFGHVAAYTSDIGLGTWVGAVALSLVGATGIAARLGVGYVSDRVGHVGPFVASALLMGAVLVLLPLATDVVGVLSLAALYGIGYGGADALLSPLAAALFGETSLYALLGIMSMALALSGLASPFLAGFVHDTLGTYTPAFVGVGVLGLCGAGCVVLANRLVGP
jgi:OFA family oxalate/formate antiporter-like MFS transporter